MKRISSVRSLLATALFTLAASPVDARAQGVLVAPPGVFIDHRTRSGSLELYNPNQVPAEITISTIFGYPVSDSAGGLSLFTNEKPDSTSPSAAGWLQAYPRRLVLAPQTRQTIRLLGRPPANLADGEYWSRLVIAAKTAPNPADSLADTSSIKVGLSFEVRTIIGVWYRKGQVSTGITLRGSNARVAGDSIALRLNLARQGNAAFLGTMRASVIDASGKSVAAFDRQLAVYYTLDPVFTFPVGALQSGAYTVRVEISTDRSDFNAGVLQAPVVRAETPMRIGPGTR